MVLIIATDTELEEQFAKAGEKLVVVDFFATWCGPCKMIAPILDTISKEQFDKVVVLKVDVDDADELATKYSITVMPTFVFFRAGKHLDTLTGADPEKLKANIAKLLK